MNEAIKKENSVYEMLCTACLNGEKVIIDFENKHAVVNGRAVIYNGENCSNSPYFNENTNLDDRFKNTRNCLVTIENLYNDFMYSVPGKHNQKSKYFYAKPEEELTVTDLITGTPRDYAKIKLEAFILCSVLSGNLKWSDYVMEPREEKWFWKSKKYPSLIILKSWIE